MKKIIIAYVCVTALFFGMPLFSQTDEEMFGGEEALVTENVETVTDTAQGLLKTESVKIGGTFNLEFGGKGYPEEWNADMESEGIAVPFAEMSLDMFADARPAENFRFFVKGSMDYSTDEKNGFFLKEAFADIQSGGGVFVRAGKQTANWGVGYFFSPGNLLDLSVIDPEDPTADRTGPLAVKLQKPVGNDTYFAYVLLDKATTGGPIGIAPKAEWVLGSAEIGLGGLWEKDAPWAVTSSVTFPLAGFDVFAEATVRGNEDKIFIVEDSAAPQGISTETRSNDLFPLATAGFNWTKSDDQNRYELGLRAQYYFNGKGYADTALFTDNSDAIGFLMAQKKITTDDLRERGLHYGAATLSVTNILDSDAGVTLFWLGNLTDLSGKASVTAIWEGLDHIEPSLSYEYCYGEKGSEYAPSGPVPSVTLKVSLTQGTF